MAFYTRSDVIPVDPSEAPAIVTGGRLDMYFRLATATLLTYDTIITMDKEIRYFWKAPLNAVSFIFFSNRYIGIFGTIAYLFRNFSVWAVDVSAWITVILIDCKYQNGNDALFLTDIRKDILTVRVLAMYSQDKRLSIFLKTLLAVEAIFKLAMVIYLALAEHLVVGSPAKNFTFCGATAKSPWQWGVMDWVVPMIYGTILLSLAVYKAVEFWKSSGSFKGATLVKIVVRDQIVYFLLVVLSSMINIIEFRIKFSSGFLTTVVLALGNPSFLSIIGSRMLFNLKEVGERGLNGGTDCRVLSRTLSDMVFDGQPCMPEECLDAEIGQEERGSVHTTFA